MFNKIFFLRILCFLSINLITLQIALSQSANEPVSLETGKQIERKISGNDEKQEFQISLNENQFAKVVIEQTEVDVSAKLYGVDGKSTFLFDDEFLLKKNETVEFVAPQSGIYKIEVKTGSLAWSGNYKISLNELRESNDRDRADNTTRNLLEKVQKAKAEDKTDEVILLLKQALETVEKHSDSASVLFNRILNELIEAYIFKADSSSAQTVYERATGFNQKNFDAENPLAARTIFLRGNLFRQMGDRAGADRNYRLALTIYEKSIGRDHPQIFDVLLKLSGLYISLDDLDGAIVYLQRAEKLVEKHYGAQHKLLAGVVNNLGVVYMSKNENDAAEKYFLRTLEVGEKANEAHQYNYSLTTQNLAAIYLSMKNYPKSLEFYDRTIKMREKIVGATHPQVGWAYYGIAGTYRAMGNRQKALENLTRAREIAEKSVGLYHSLTTISLRDAATLYASQGDTEKAVDLQKLHDERYEKNLASELTIGSERQKLLYTERIQNLTSMSISLHANAARNNRTALETAMLVVLQRKGRVFDAVAHNLAEIRRRADEKDRALLDRLGDVNSRIAKLALNKPPKMIFAEYDKQIAELERQREQIEVEISDRNALFALQNPKVTLEAVKTEIPANAALVEYAVYLPFDYQKYEFGKARYIAYVLTKDGEIKYAELGDKQTIDLAIDNLRKSLHDRVSKNVKQLARAVDEKIFQPIRPLLGETSHILVSPDGELNQIPFEALVGEKGNYLIENYLFTYLTSGRDLLRKRMAGTSKNESLILANPSFGEAINANAARQSATATRNLSETFFAPLSGTLQEARSIQNIFPDTIFLNGTEATETALKNAFAPKLLHIATHGYFLQDTDKTKSEIENPLLRSGLAFAGANRREGGGNDDGILTALEASGLNLWGTKLVVLSACDTGLGEVKTGEGVYGLRRAFVLAGTESLVMSLWSVSDFVTRELMTDYYKNLKSGIGRGESLRKVQLQMLKKKGREHPFYWAAFIHSGDWRGFK
jgi:CHAT domain-containing protein